MEHIKILREFHPRIEKDMVFRQIQCFPDSPVYEEIEDTYRDIETEMLKLCEPAGVMALGKIPAGYFQQEREQSMYWLRSARNSAPLVQESLQKGIMYKGC